MAERPAHCVGTQVLSFAAAAANQLFDSFYTTKEDGMGIGLSVSQSIIRARRGPFRQQPTTG